MDGTLKIFKTLAMEGKTVNVTKGATVTEANVNALAALTGILGNDDVAYTATLYTIDANTYTSAADAATALSTLTANVGDITVKVDFSNDLTGTAAANYKLAGGSVDGTLHVYTYSGGGGGGFSAPATYAISVKSDENGEVTSSVKAAAKGTAITITVAADKGYTLETLTAKDASGKTVALTDKGNGEYTFTMPASKVTVSATFAKAEIVNPFVDVFENDFFYDAVLWAAENEITAGTDATHFSPNVVCTRAQMVTFLWRAAGCPAPKTSDCAFVDVDMNSYYGEALLWAIENGITKGTTDTTFTPDAIVSRGQMATFLYRFAKAKNVKIDIPFEDVADSAYYYDAVAWAFANEITKGTSDTTFSPDADCTRAQIVTFLYRFFVD